MKKRRELKLEDYFVEEHDQEENDGGVKLLDRPGLPKSIGLPLKLTHFSPFTPNF